MSGNLLRNRWQQLTESDVRRLQAEQLRHYLRNVVLPFSAHYRKIFNDLALDVDSIRSLDDLRHIPFTSKSDLLSTPQSPTRFKDFILIPDEKVLTHRPSTILRALMHGRQQVRNAFESEFRPIFMTFTTGRSAEPTPFLFTQYDIANLGTAARRVVEICAARREDRLLNTLPFAPHLAFWLAHYAGTEGCVMTLSSGGGKVMGTEGNLRHIRKFKPDVLIGIPTFVYHLLTQAADEGMRCENLRHIVLAGEKVSDGLRVKLRDLARDLGAPNVNILATYGFTEAKQAWTECPYPHHESPSGYHVYPDLALIEIVDPQTGEILPPGTPGEIVFTPLDARGSVVLRYRTGDHIDGGLTYERCPNCGRSLPRLFGNISRRSEIKQMHLDKIKGTLVDFNELEHVLDDVQEIGAWQIELRKLNDDPLDLDELILHVQKLNGCDESQLSRDLSKRCFENLDVRPNRIVFHDAEQIRKLQGVGTVLKEQKFVDHRPSCLSNGSTGRGLLTEPLAETAASETKGLS